MHHIRSSILMTLRDGTEVVLRPVRPRDRERFQQGLELLSMESRYLRFFQHVTELTDEQLVQLTQVDQINHVAWGALDPDDPNFPGYGVGRFVRSHDDHEVAEVAFAVIDSFQRKGLGAILMALMYLLAGLAGIRYFRGTVISGNHFMVDWLHRLGGETVFTEGAYQIQLPVLQDFSSFDRTPTMVRFRALLEEIREKLFLDDVNDVQP